MLGEEISTEGPIHNIYYQYIIYNSESLALMAKFNWIEQYILAFLKGLLIGG